MIHWDLPRKPLDGLLPRDKSPVTLWQFLAGRSWSLTKSTIWTRGVAHTAVVTTELPNTYSPAFTVAFTYLFA